MKKSILILLLFMTIVNLPAFSQVKFGLKGGINATCNDFTNEEYYDKKNYMGFFFGPTIKIDLPFGFAVDGSVLYDQRSSGVALKPIEMALFDFTTIKQQHIAVPIHLRFGVGLSEMVNLFIYAGPQFGFNVGNKTISESYTDWDFNKAQVSFNTGLGVLLFNHLQISANYNLACSKSAVLVFNRDYAPEKEGDSKMNALQFGLTYFF